MPHPSGRAGLSSGGQDRGGGGPNLITPGPRWRVGRMELRPGGGAKDWNGCLGWRTTGRKKVALPLHLRPSSIPSPLWILSHPTPPHLSTYPLWSSTFHTSSSRVWFQCTVCIIYFPLNSPLNHPSTISFKEAKDHRALNLSGYLNLFL